MLALLTPIDYGILGLFVAMLLGLGAYFSPLQTNTTEYFLAGRSLGWLPVGLSLTAVFVSTLGLTLLPTAAYDFGWKCWIVVLALWLVLPVVAFVAVPIYRGLGITSLYEYLEQRFSPGVRLAASLLFVAWRLIWIVAAIYLSCEAIHRAAGWNVPAWLVAIPIGGLATVVAFLGGLRASAWSGVLKGAAMFGAAAVVVIAIWSNLSGSAERVAEITRGLGRLEPVQLQFTWTDSWTLWGALPFWVLAVLTFFVADQAFAQRLLATKTENLARTAFLSCALALSLLLPALVYVGTGLLAFYYDHPQAMRPEWVVNVDGKSHQPVRNADGRPLLNVSDPAQAVTFENIDRLVAEGRILQPNNKEPFASAAGLVDPDNNQILVEKLAMRRPNYERLRGEMIVRHDSPQEMLPQFARQHLSWGAAGLVLAALLATALAAADAGLNSVTSVVIRDLVGRFGWGRAWLAQRAGKAPDQLSAADELQLARPLMLVLGAAATIAATLIAALLPAAGQAEWMMAALCALGAPLTGVFLLGMFTRRTSAAGALLALVGGLTCTTGIGLATALANAGVIPETYRLAPIWPAIGGFAFTLVAGYAVSFVAGRQKSSVDLRGLVVGCGELGRLAADEAIPLISVPEEGNEIRWK